MALVLGAMLTAIDAPAQNYPAKPIRILVGFAPGGSTDVVARMIAQKVSENLGQNVVVENRPGAGGALATERVVTSPPDGHTLLMMSISDTVLPALRKLPYDVERDLTPVSMTTILPILLVVHPSVPARNVKELVALARSRPGKLNYGSAGIGSASHLPGELLNLMAGVNIAHVAYKGGADNVIATVSGQVDMSYTSITAGLPLLDSGKLRALAVTSARRASVLPSVPTIAESGLAGYERVGWNGVLAPAGLRKEIVATLNGVIGKAMSTTQMKDWLERQGLEPRTNTPDEFSTFIRRELAQNARLIKLTGAKAE